MRAVLLLLAVGCSAINEDNDPFAPLPVPDAGAPDVIPLAPTYEALYEHIFKGCRFTCHSGGPDNAPAGFDMGDDETSMVGVAATGADCAPTGLMRIAPGDPEASVLYSKVAAKHDGTAAVCGLPMPDGINRPPVTTEELDALRQWIASLAP